MSFVCSFVSFMSLSEFVLVFFFAGHTKQLCTVYESLSTSLNFFYADSMCLGCLFFVLFVCYSNNMRVMLVMLVVMVVATTTAASKITDGSVICCIIPKIRLS